LTPLKHSEIYGNWATLLVPVNKDNSINYTLLAEEIDILIAMQVNGIYSNGTAGEFYNQTEAEFQQINSLLAEKCNTAQMPFQVGCSHMSPQLSLERLRFALDLQPSAVQVILPDWFPPSMPECIRFLERMADVAAPVGLVLYNPPHAKIRLSPAEFGQILEAGIPLAGCKVPGGDAAWYAAMKAAAPELSIFVPGHHLATGISLGAHGAYSNVACLHPGVAQQWYDTMRTDINKALELETRIQLFMARYIVPYISGQGFSNQAADKLLAAIGGWADIGTRLRWPYQGIDPQEVVHLRKACREILPEFCTNIKS
jgi:4-hydroxy-tetrahydrodipicolinate synthase